MHCNVASCCLWLYVCLYKDHKRSCLIVLLLQDLSDAALYGSQLLIDLMQELLQIHTVQLTALNQHLIGRIMAYNWSEIAFY